VFQLYNFLLQLLTIDWKDDIFSYVINGVVKIKTFDELPMGLSQLIEQLEIAGGNVFLVWNVIVCY
jgi:hypothetical protein